jgi:tetratricopeptide (TPR) repeat protein
MSDEYKRKEIKSTYQRAVELYKNAVDNITHNAETQRELTPFLKRHISETFLKAAELFEKSGKLDYARHGFEGALKYAPNKDYEAKAKQGLADIQKSKEGGLEKQLLSIMSIATLLASLFFVSSDLTGFAISNISQDTSLWIGFCFFVCGLVFAFLFLKNKRKFSKHL